MTSDHPFPFSEYAPAPNAQKPREDPDLPPISVPSPDRIRLLLTQPVTQAQVRLFQKLDHLYDCRFRSTQHPQISSDLDGEPLSPADLTWAQVIVGNPPAALLSDCPNLRWLQICSAGVEQYVRPGVLPAQVQLTNATGAYGLAISEYMMGVMLSIQKKLHLYRDAQQHRVWQSLGQVRSVYQSTVLVVGLGDIGSEFAARCRAMGAHVIGLRRRLAITPNCVDEVYLTEDLDKVLPLADVVALTLPITPQTIGILSRERIDAMKQDAILLNVGRGTLIDTKALCDALARGHLMGAALDVTDPEPLPKDHPLWRFEQVILTPHVSGSNHLQETEERISRIIQDNLIRFAAKIPLRNLVDLQAGYTK